MNLSRLFVIVAAFASTVNLAVTISSDAQTSYDDVQAALQRIESRQIGGCP